MKEWFPFTDYDFYAYLACGLVVLCGADYWHSGGQYILHNDWTFIQGLLAVAVAYVAGQIIAMPSSLILENAIARGILRPPVAVQVSDTQGKAEQVIGKYLIGRYYAPLPQSLRTKILQKAQRQTGLNIDELRQNPDELFMPAYHAARQSEDTCKRMDDFRNQYGFNRNMAFSGLVVMLLMLDKALRGGDVDAYGLAALALILSLGMFVRFLKFYACFAAEVLRAYALIEDKP